MNRQSDMETTTRRGTTTGVVDVNPSDPSTIIVGEKSSDLQGQWGKPSTLPLSNENRFAEFDKESMMRESNQRSNLASEKQTAISGLDLMYEDILELPAGTGEPPSVEHLKQAPVQHAYGSKLVEDDRVKQAASLDSYLDIHSKKSSSKETSSTESLSNEPLLDQTKQKPMDLGHRAMETAQMAFDKTKEFAHLAAGKASGAFESLKGNLGFGSEQSLGDSGLESKTHQGTRRFQQTNDMDTTGAVLDKEPAHAKPGDAADHPKMTGHAGLSHRGMSKQNEMDTSGAVTDKQPAHAGRGDAADHPRMSKMGEQGSLSEGGSLKDRHTNDMDTTGAVLDKEPAHAKPGDAPDRPRTRSQTRMQQ